MENLTLPFKIVEPHQGPIIHRQCSNCCFFSCDSEKCIDIVLRSRAYHLQTLQNFVFIGTKETKDPCLRDLSYYHCDAYTGERSSIMEKDCVMLPHYKISYEKNNINNDKIIDLKCVLTKEQNFNCIGVSFKIAPPPTVTVSLLEVFKLNRDKIPDIRVIQPYFLPLTSHEWIQNVMTAWRSCIVT